MAGVVVEVEVGVVVVVGFVVEARVVVEVVRMATVQGGQP